MKFNELYQIVQEHMNIDIATIRKNIIKFQSKLYNTSIASDKNDPEAKEFSKSLIKQYSDYVNSNIDAIAGIPELKKLVNAFTKDFFVDI